MRSLCPPLRLRQANGAPIRTDRSIVLYWMISARRTRFSWALQRAVEWATELDLPLVILEPLRSAYPWASDRLHRFIIDGMAENLRRLEGRRVTYHAYVEPEPAAGRGLLSCWASRAAVVITDDFPTFFIPRMVRAAAARLDVGLEVVDGNGVIPMAAVDAPQATAVAFRRRIQRQMLDHLEHMPAADPLDVPGLSVPIAIPEEITRRWPAATSEMLAPESGLERRLPLDHSVPSAELRGGTTAAERHLRDLLERKLQRYAEARNRPDDEATSNLSPYLHFGHIGAHEVLAEVLRHAQWSPELVARQARGQREGWWGAGPQAEAFLDQLVTWRELGFNTCHHIEHPERYETLPEWARLTLARHAGDERPHLYDLGRFAAAQTHDPLWNAAQRQLLREGRIHGYLRMLWGKKILEWSAEPMEALETMLELNNRYALDGRDPSSTSGICWVMGRYDRGWPERAIYGKVRSMSSKNTARKVPVQAYLERYGPESG